MYIHLFLRNQFFSDSAKGLWLDSQIGSDEVLWDALGEMRVFGCELKVSFACFFAIGFRQSVLQIDKSILDEYSEKVFEQMAFFANGFIAFLVDYQDIRILKCFDCVDATLA